MLTEKYRPDMIATALSPIHHYEPVPAASRRDAWLALDDEVRSFWIRKAEACLGMAWPALPAALYMDYVRTGNRSRYQEPYFARRKALVRLVLAECMEYGGRFLDDIVNGMWAMCEESTWCWPAHLNGISRVKNNALPDIDRPVFDLGAGETAALLAWSYYMLRQALDEHCPPLGKRLRRELQTRILDTYEREDGYWWMSFQPDLPINNWNPWCNANCLAVLLLIEEKEERRAALVHKALRSLDRFIASYEEDGGCDEGPAYWVRAAASLYDALQLVHAATDGAIDVFGERKIRNMAAYILHMHIGGDAYVNFADSAARLTLPAGLIARFGQAVGDARLEAFGRYVYRRQGGHRYWDGEEIPSLQRMLFDLFAMPGMEGPATDPPALPLDRWMPGVEVMVARERGDGSGWFLAAKGGHNDESHNHNDIGSFIVYADQLPLWIDAGVGTYTAKTFSPERYSIWTMQSGYHNVPTVNGTEQAAGAAYRSGGVRHEAEGGLSRLTVDIAPAYPASSGISRWMRTFTLRREPAGGRGQGEPDFASRIIVEEAVKLEEPSMDVTLNWLCAYAPRFVSGRVVLVDEAGAAKACMSYDETLWNTRVEPIALEDERLCAAWGDTIYRVLLTAKRLIHEESWQFVLKKL
ncbi:heparinase [Paenibacillus dendritiformis]|uniref:heparinase II/III domain-containing protein n=2 Tax=Paenibacillus TaxID=44249 RepID=UPI00143D4B67|nr:heparinase II/III family protein [Paenibacillus dendritiformis]NKI24312.1 heparinase [Paenibacillus dendritiformis]NRF97149.1 heparinase II/III family protein [Paenibacillus dendritiformis]